MVPVVNVESVIVAVKPEIPSGFSVQFPDGNPLKVTLPVARTHVGCVIEAIIGLLGVMGCALITTLAEAKEIQPPLLVTV